MPSVLFAQLNRAWKQGLAVMLSPIISGEKEWVSGLIAIYIYSPDPRNKEPWRGNPCHVANLGQALTKTLDWVEKQLIEEREVPDAQMP